MFFYIVLEDEDSPDCVIRRLGSTSCCCCSRSSISAAVEIITMQGRQHPAQQHNKAYSNTLTCVPAFTCETLRTSTMKSGTNTVAIRI